MAFAPYKRGSVLLGVVVATLIFAGGTAVTLHFGSDASGDTLDPYKIGGTWLFVGAIAGRVAFNVRNPKPASSVAD